MTTGMVLFAADAATGWALAGYIALIVVTIGVAVFTGWVLYRIGLWFVLTWYGPRFGITDASLSASELSTSEPDGPTHN